ncbi:M50 family metallopeptidase [Vulgatibacter sp.]|uniref:M50 family metallopeptidase n=1 Tax=Vulgatibacter sp. TaxID=1971226 RepID=UPI003567AA28
MNLLVAILVFGLLIAIHEAGHFLVARWAGMRVERFSIGFGPALATFRRGETEWRIGILPIGGYVKIAGMNPAEEAESDPGDPASYANKPAWKRLLVILAGSFMNYVLAWVLLVGLLLAGAAQLQLDTTEVGAVMPDMPAAAAGLQAGDEIVAVDGKQVEDFRSVAESLAERKAQNVSLTVERDGRRFELPVVTNELGQIGIRPPETIVSYGVAEAVQRATTFVVVGSLAIVQGIVDLVRGEAQGGLMGPVGIASEVARQAERGMRWLLGIAVNLSIALGFFNLLPIPALDGGRAAFILVEMVRRKPVDARAEAWVHLIGFVVLLGLILVVTVGDVGRLTAQ